VTAVQCVAVGTLVALGWFALALLVAVVVGRMLRHAADTGREGES
jgi:hypothetical protein